MGWGAFGGKQGVLYRGNVKGANKAVRSCYLKTQNLDKQTEISDRAFVIKMSCLLVFCHYNEKNDKTQTKIAN